MPISKDSLSAIQSAGAAAHHADAALKSVVQAYADQVRLAMSSNPFDLQTDSLFEEWKTVARLSQTMEQIEAELRKVHQAAQQLGVGSFNTAKPKPQLAAPASAPVAKAVAALPLVELVEATDVVAKKPGKAKAVTKASKADATPKAASTPKLSANTQKLLAHLQSILSSRKFTEVKTTAEGIKAGLPSGSVTASLNKLIETGYLEKNAAGALKLITKK